MLTDVEIMRLLDHRLGGPTLVRENVVHVGLHVGFGVLNLSTGANFSEPVDESYFRVPLGNNTETWTSAAKLVSGPYEGAIAKYNAVEIAFPASTVPWGPLTHVGLFSASTGGSPFAIAIVESPPTVDDGGLVRFQPGGLMLFLRRPE